MLQALSACGVYFQIRPRLAYELVAQDGRVWLRHVLGWLAYAREAGADTESRLGATIYPVLRERQMVPDRYLPPPQLSFAQALAWAQSRGVPAPDPGPPPPAEQLPAPEPDPPRPESSEDQLWSAVLARLRPQVTTEVFTGRLMQARLARSPTGGWLVLAPSVYAADWLRLRLHITLTRELSAVLGDPALELSIESQSERRATDDGRRTTDDGRRLTHDGRPMADDG
jgi:hypothetical protein